MEQKKVFKSLSDNNNKKKKKKKEEETMKKMKRGIKLKQTLYFVS